MIYYLPGCDVQRRHPEGIRKLQELMSGSDIIPAQCCRKDVSYFKKDDTLIMNCTQCQLIMAERIPEVNRVSLYEYILNESGFRWPDYQGYSMTLQDCWRTRKNPDIQNAIRKCLENMNIHVIELDHRKENADFCGVWLNNPAMPDCAEAAPETFKELEQYRHLLTEEQQKENMETYVRRFKTREVIVYCNGCEKGILLGGGKPVHMIDLLTGLLI